MSVIARKIAIAKEPTVERPDAARLADRLIETLKPILQNWLSLDDFEVDCRSVVWNDLNEDQLTDMLVAAQGTRRAHQFVISASPELANFAVTSLLRMSGANDPAALSALRPFALQNLVALGERLNASPFMTSAGGKGPSWSYCEGPTLMDRLEPYDILNLDLALTIPGFEGLGLRLLVTSELLSANSDDTDSDDIRPQSTLPPRLGPCHVEVLAIGDRVALSVADCTRLEIGQVVALPGLRFDRLDLDVEMGDGPIRLTDAALGADKGQKAVRLNRGLDPAFREKPNTPPEDVSK